MSGTFSLSVQEQRGFVAVNADVDKLAVVLGCSSAGSGLSSFYLSGSAAVTGVGYGDAVDTLTQIIEQRQSSGNNAAKFPAALYTTPGTTPGSYGTIDNTSWTGTSVPAVVAASVPLGTYEARLKIITGGTVGTAGITFQTSLDGGRNYGTTTALGTADYVLIANSGVKFLLNPGSTDVTALYTLINEEFGDYNAHVILTTGTVHTNADTGDQVNAGTYPSATTPATAIARMNALRAAALLHFPKGTGGTPATHINAPGDATAVTTLSAAAVCTDLESCLTLALAFKAALNAHDANVVAHTIADATNVVTSSAPATGTAVAGDIAKCRTFGPAPIGTDLDTAFTALAASTVDMGLIILDCDCNAALAAHVTTGLNTLAAVGKRCAAIVRTRIPTFETSETEAAWVASVAADYASFTDSRISVRGEYGLLTDAMTTRQYMRSDLAQFAADVVRVPRAEWPCCPADAGTGLGGIPNFTLIDSTGATVGHDEGPRGAVTGLSNDTLGNRFASAQRIAEPSVREAVFNTVPWVMYAADERIRNLPTRRLANAMERTAVAAGLPRYGGKVFYTRTSATTGTLTPASRKAIQGAIYQAVSGSFATEIDNAHDASIDSGLVQVAPGITLSGGNLVGISVTLAPVVGGFVISETFTLAIVE